MTIAEWEVLYAMYGILIELAFNASNYSKSLADQLKDLDRKLQELPVKDDEK